MAVAIDPGLASAWSALAAITILYDRKYEARRRALPQGARTGSGLRHGPPLVRHSGLPRLQRMRQALDEMREAERLEPLSAAIANDIGFVLYRSRRFDDATEQARRTIAHASGLLPGHALLARIYAPKANIGSRETPA